MQIWLTILVNWPEPGLAETLAHPRIGRDHGFGAGIGVCAAAAHHGQHAVFRASLAARHRRIDEFEPCLGGGGVEFARDLGGSGGVVDEGRALFMPAKAPSAPMVIARRSLSLPTQAITKS